jgi:hypothetical protein
LLQPAKKQQEAYDNHQNKRQKMNAVRLRGDFYSSDKEDEVEVIITVRTPSSLQGQVCASLCF